MPGARVSTVLIHPCQRQARHVWVGSRDALHVPTFTGNGKLKFSIIENKISRLSRSNPTIFEDKISRLSRSNLAIFEDKVSRLSRSNTIDGKALSLSRLVSTPVSTTSPSVLRH